MKFTFRNLGLIKKAEMELKPLTVIIGPNNANKTYIAYSIYGLMDCLSQLFSRRVFARPFREPGDSVYWKASLQELRLDLQLSVATELNSFERDLPAFFQDSSGRLFADTKYGVEFSQDELKFAITALSGKPIVGFTGTYDAIVDEETVTLSPVSGGKTLPFQGTSDETFIDKRLGVEMLTSISHELFSRPYLLPAERNALVITYKVLANRRLKLMLDAQRRLFTGRKKTEESTQRQLEIFREAGEVRYPQPVEDFLELLFEIENSNPDEGKREIRRTVRRPPGDSTPQSHIATLADEIERNMQNGNKIGFRRTALGGREIMVDVGNDLNIDLYNASSSIKQLTPLLLYLRHRASPNDLIIIDEPEMNLHPESQAKLLEILAMLVNARVKVLLTTHSPYIMAHLNNLVLLEEPKKTKKKRMAQSLYLENPAAFLQMSAVSAYEMHDGELHDLKDPDYGIRWDTFSDVSAELQQIYFQIHE